MGAKTRGKPSPEDLRRLRRKLQRLDTTAPGARREYSRLLAEIELAKAQLTKSRAAKPRRSTTTSRRRRSTVRKRATAAGSVQAPTTGKANNLSKWLSPKNLQESLKTVGNLRGTVKNWLQYLQQADQLLDTLYITSNSLKDTGVIEKLVKSKGKNLTTEDFTNILVALMNTPIGAQFFKSDNGGSANAENAGQ